MNKEIRFSVYGCMALLVLLAVIAVKSCLTEPLAYNTLTREKITEIRDDSITYWKDQYGREHAQKQIAEAGLDEVKSVYGPVIDSVMKALKIQGKQLEQLTIAGMTTSNRVPLQVDTVYKDSATQYHFSYRDPWIDLNGRIGKDSYLDYTTYDSLITTGYTKRRGFLGLGAKETFVDVYSINPHSKVTSLQGIRILKERPKRFGIGPFVGYGYAAGRWTPMIGIGLNYSLIKF